MITQPRWGVFGQRYGSFAGKSGAGGEHPVDKITQPRWGVFGQRYGDFSGKEGAVPAVAVSTGDVFALELEDEWRKQRQEEEEVVSLVIALHESR
jgi:hypothetical protein